jgi:periplasmic protein TonB
MERPSHMIFIRHRSFSQRAPLFAAAIGLQLAGFWLFTHGLAVHVPTIIRDFQFVPTHEKEAPPVKPPEPVLKKKLDVPVAVPPEFTTELPARGGGILTTTVPPVTDTGASQPRENRIHAAVGILSTHTVPPYPPIARRLGAEGRVTLRLTVSAEGRVTQADIVNSSGQDELDQTAQQWIVAHWSYKPALNDGVPVVSQVLATVSFSLSSQH